MSLKLILNKLTSMVLVICMLLSLAAPAVGEEPLTQPTEETAYSDGSTVYADGTVMYPDGTIVYADGTTVYADGTTVDAEGTTIYPDGTAVYPDGKMVYADGTTVYPDGTTVYADGTVVYANGTIVYADGTTVHADGTTVNADGTTVYPDGTTVYADGTMVYVNGTVAYPDGTVVYPDGTTNSVLEEEQVPLAAPELYAADTLIETEGEYSEENTAVVTENPETDEQKTADPAAPADPTAETQPVTDGEAAAGEEKTPPVIPGKEAELAEEAAKAEKTENTEKQESTEVTEPAESEPEEEPEETIEGQTEENPEETAENTLEDTEDTTEETTEETTEDAAEDTAEDTAEEEPEETAAPAEELPLRTLTVSAGQMAFRDQYLNPTEPVLWSGSVWNWLYGSAIEPSYIDGRVTVEISGHLPESVTARAMFIEFADPSAAQNDERALMLLDVALLDETGALYVPTEKLHVSVSSASISGAAESGEPFAAYFDDSYDGIGAAGDIKVRLDENIDGSRLAYVPEQNEALRFWEAGGRLVSNGNGTVEFNENRFPFRFVLSAQQEAREEDPAEQENVVKDVSLSGTLVASDGYTYEVSVSYPANCGIPVGAQLSVEELILGSDAYWDYINQSAAELGVSPADLSLARAFDISFVDPETGVHYQPTQDVQVSILLISTPVNAEEELAVLHFDDEAGQVQAMDVALNGEAIEFETGSFSVFVVLQRVIEKNLDAGDGYTYHISVDYDNTSGIPDGVELVADELLEGDAFYDAYVTRAAAELGESVENLSFARAFNISLMDPLTGIYYQPNKNVKVSIQILNDHLADYASIDVVHFGNDVEIIDASVNGETVAFTTVGFSVYVITGSNGETVTPQCTYTFWSPNTDETGYKEFSFTDSQGNTVFKQVVTRGQELIIPQPNSVDGKIFAGWYEGNPDGSGGITLAVQPYDFDNIKITENSAADLYAVYTDYATVIFHDQYDSDSNTFPVVYTRRAELVTTGEGAEAVTNATVKIDDLSIANTSVGGKNMAFFGWSKTPITTPGAAKDDGGNDVAAISTDAEGCITVTGEKHLYPIFKEIHWLTYYTAKSGSGADYVAPARYFKGDVVPAPLPTTAMEGYTFLGWWTGTLTTEGNDETVNYGAQITYPDGNLVASADDGGVYISGGKLYLRSDATLFAKWEAKSTADYRIVIYTQSLSDADDLTEADKTYVFRESVQLSGTIGTAVSVREEDKNKTYTGYVFARCYDSKTIAADGSTVLNVYYDKNSGYTPSGSYTLTFADSATEGASTDLPVVRNNITYGESITDRIPANPTRRGYEFTKWYLDPDCTVEASLSTMPDHDLTVYAGWETGWYVVTIDPNYGALYAEENGVGTGSTWFWSSYEGEPVGEYRHVTRDYVESSAGTWYFVNHAGDGLGGNNGWPDRHTYYTQDPSKATEDTTFEYSPGVYTYAGWYEVHEDGTETPYIFGGHTDHNMTLRLHWKRAGTYYLAFAAGEGTLDDGSTKNLLLPDGYADYAEIVLTESATAPSGYTFVGWQVRGSDSTAIYTPGQTFTLHADDAQRVGGKDVVYLDAVYVRVGTASIVYNANGGTVAAVEGFDFGWTFNTQNQPVPATGTIDAGAGTATVSGLTNNSKFRLSSGTNFTNTGTGFTLAGWSNKAVYDPNDSDAELYTCGGDYGVDKEEPTTLYAVWQTTVTYHLNETNASWGGSGENGSWGDPYVYDSTASTHTLDIYLNNIIFEPAFIPAYTGTETRLFRYWATRSGEGTEASPYVFTQYDFSQPLTGALDLYAFWSEAAVVTVHAVEASEEALNEITNGNGWTIQNITAGTTEKTLSATSHVTAPTGYAFAFAAVSADLASISERNAVTDVKYDTAKKSVCVKYAGASDFTELEEGAGIWFVYYQEKKLSIGYKSMESSGALSDVTSTGATETDIDLGTYTMETKLSEPLGLVTGYTYYGFAIGGADTHNDPQMNASNLSLLTDAAGAEDPVPMLRVRNTWRGFEYTTEAGDGAAWVSCGYDPHLYVIYYTQLPTTIIFREETVGTSAVMDTPFTYNVKVEQTVTDGESVTTSTLFDTAAEGNSPYTLKTGEERSAILFYSAQEGGTTIKQTITITQTENEAFTTSVGANSGTATQPNKWEYTSNGATSTQTVTFTNTHKSLPVTVHVAIAENDGSTGIIRRDNLRSTTETDYTFNLPLRESAQLLTRLPSASVFTDDTNTYAFGAVMYGSAAANDGDAVTVGALGVATVAYERRDGNVYELVLKDSDGNILTELGSETVLYYLYYPMPKIQYVKENNDGSLTPITGCLMNTETGNIEPSDSVTYSHALLTMNGKTVVQNQSFEVPMSGFTISQSGNNFRMPPILDDGLYERYLGYVKLGAGGAGAANTSALDLSTSLTMQLKVQNNTLQYSFDGSVWKNLPISGGPTIYAIYTERGYDLQLSKTVNTSESGENAIFMNSSYSVTISSAAITKESYAADGAESDTVTATPTDGVNPGTITFTVQDGTRIRIKGLGRGDYTVTESGNENYTLTARTGPIVGGTTSAADVTDNTTVSLTLNDEMKLDLTNSPKAICRIGDHYFYTLQSMVDYVDSEIASKTANVEMLTDYVMPAADTVEIPSGFNLTIETEESGFSGAGSLAVITRTEELADVPLFTSSGALTFKNIVLDGNSVEATAPMIRSAGDLTIDEGATIQNANGGAINETAGNITVKGTISGCSAENGSAIYYTGNGAISLSGQGEIKSNTATTGNGGAIYMTGGTLTLSGMSGVTGNKAEYGKGGAVYAESGLLTVDQNASLTNNTAAVGGAFYVETGTVTISKTENYNPPAITGNSASSGNGGALWIGTGSVSISGGSLSGNKAENGMGGAIFSDNATVSVSGTAELSSNTAQSGGAVYANTGAVAVTGGSLESNKATTGTGGAVCGASGTVTLSGPVSLKTNKATSGNGGAVFAASIDATLNQAAQITGNEAGSGGAIHAASGTITLSASTVNETVVSPTVTGNKATQNGGAIWLGTGSITVSGGSLSNNEAKGNGGAVCTEGASVMLSSVTVKVNSADESVAPTVQGNKAENGSGGAVYSDSGAITISAGTIGGTENGQGNTAGQNGGVLYAGSGAVTIGAVTMSGNTATTGNGGAVYIGSGAAELSGPTINSNRAANGAAVFVDTGRARFSAGTYTNNVATAGGAVGMGSTDARLTFSGNVQVKDNKLGTADDAPKSNVCLNQDSSDVLNFAGLGDSASIGIYVPDTLTAKRDVPGSRFGSYTSDSNVDKITNDRFDFSVQKDTAATKLFWGMSIQVQVRYLASFDVANDKPPTDSPIQRKYPTSGDYATYYPEFSSAAISELASELYNKYSFNPGSSTAVYAVSFTDDATAYADYITNLTWDSTGAKWTVTKRDGTQEDLGTKKIIIYYAEPAYISIENNTDMALTISGMTVNNASVINSNTVVGYGMVFAKNGAIRSALLPVTVEDLQLAANRAVTLLIPGGRSMDYTLAGSFATDTAPSVRLRRGLSTSPDEKTLNLDNEGKFESLTDASGTETLDPANTLAGTTLAGSGTYQIVFGDNKVLCKVVDANGVEHPYSKISDALTEIKNGTVSLAAAKTATIEMVTDYLLPTSDKVLIPRGFDITLTTAKKAPDGGQYPYTGEEDRATISRDSLNTGSMIESYDDAVKNDGTVLRLKDLIIDGKAVLGSSDGGAVRTRYCNVYVDTVDFKNVYAGNGGALYVIFETDGKIVAGTLLDVKNSNFTGCNSTKATGSRLGGGAIHTSAQTLTMTDCTFESCQASDQAGAVFHRVEGNYTSNTTISGCTFNNCRGKAAGGLELDSKTITVTNTTFTNCVATERNGGGFNVFALNSASPSSDCYVTLEGCTFTNCQANNYGGGFRSTSVYTKVMDCTFTNTSAIGKYTSGNNGNGAGGAIGISSGNAKKAEIYACTITGCTVNGKDGYGGGIYYAGEDLTIGDTYTSIIDNTEYTKESSITNCTAKQQGGGVYYNKGSGYVMITSTEITGNSCTNTASSNNNARGGGVCALANTVTVTGGSISNNTAVKEGGGLYTNAAIKLTITGTTISGNASTGSNGGGVYYAPATDSVPLTVNSCTIENNTAANGNGGGIWTSAGPVTIGKADGDENGTVIRSCTAKSGGGIYHDKNSSNASLTLTDATVSGCRATNGGGGGIRTNGWAVTLTGATVSNNNATSDGGGLVYYGANDDNRSLTVNGSTIEGNTSGGNGGGIYTTVKTVAVNSPYTVTVGEETVNKAASVSNNTASNGGGIYHSRNTEGSALNVTGTEEYPVTISGNQTGSAGGGVYANVRNTKFKWAEISGNRANGSGGGVYDPIDGTAYSLTLDHTSVTGNTSGNQGGGIYTKTQLYLKNASLVTGNRLTGSTVENSAGVYLQNNRTLYVGSEGADSDSSSVKENYTASGAASNLRLWWDSTNKQNAAGSTYVYCDLSGYIGVVNAAKVGTQFGTSDKANPAGFSDDNPVFKADTSTLHGIIDRTDETGTKIIWAGPPIAKITDGDGNMLYLKQGTDSEGKTFGTSPAIFDRLYSGNEDAESIAGAFNVLNSENLGLQTDDPNFDSSKPMLYNADGTPYTGTEFCVKMLVETYTSDNLIFIKGVEGRTVTFTTAGTEDALYPSEAKRATVKAGNISKSFLSPRGNLVLENIVIDGSDKVRVMWFEPKVPKDESTDTKVSTVTLGVGAVIQNGKADNGGGVYIKHTNNTVLAPTFDIKGGVIRSCTSTDGNNGGGAIYMNSGTIDFEAGNITECTASGSGGGVFLNTGTFNMSGGTISGCSAKKGGGVLVPNNSSAPFNMSGGFIVNNTATATGGGIAVNGGNSRIYFSQKVNVSGNKATKDRRQVDCNVELNQDSNYVINTNNGGLYSGSYIGVYVPNGAMLYDKHGVERKPFGSFANGDDTTNLYSFVNDRNGFKGGIIEHPAPNTIYWIKIFSLQISKTVEAGGSTVIDPDEPFLFKVNIRGTPSVSGQLRPEQIDSNTGVYGDMMFTSNGADTTTAVFTLKNDESITGVNLSEGLDYEIIEYLVVSGGGYDNQYQRYAAMPMNGYSGAAESLEYAGTTYTVIKANTYSSKIGENKDRTDVDPYTSAVPFTNLMPVCKITDTSGNLLYRRYSWEKTTNMSDEQAYYYAPAVYTELTGDNGAFKALEGTLYSSNGSNPSSYSVSNGVKIQMLIGSYNQTENITLPSTVDGKVTLTTASAEDELFPKQDAGTTSTIRRGGFTDASMFTVEGDLTLESIILDGAKGTYTANANGGLVSVPSGGKLTILTGATLQNSKTSQKGGAVYVDNGGTVTMTGGTVNKNESNGDGAGVYLAYTDTDNQATLYLSGSPYFGGTGLTVAGNITTANGNWKDETLTNELNGAKQYLKPRQDIFIAGYHSDDEGDVSADSLVITGDIGSGDGTIWVWAAELPRYKSLCQFAKYEDGVTDTAATLATFRNARQDKETGADQVGRYLYGVTKSADTGGNAFWYGTEGSRRVILRKVSSTFEALSGAEFKIHRGSMIGTLVESTDINGQKDSTFISGGSGVYFIDDLPYGTYYINETKNAGGVAVNIWFTLTVNEDGVGYLNTQGEQKNYSNQLRP